MKRNRSAAAEPRYQPHAQESQPRPVCHPALIRTCRAEDLRLLEWDGLFTHHREIIERTYREQLAGTQIMLVADVDGLPSAQVWIDLQRGRDRSAGVVWALRVRPALQGRGIGTRLLDAAEEIVRQHGFQAAELSVETGNDGARRLYASRGYTDVQTITRTYSYTTPQGDFHEHTSELLDMRKELWDLRLRAAS